MASTRPFLLAVFLSAYLLFLVQPLIAKQILPWFGGAPAVWSTSLLFFQLALVLGYSYAHVTRRLGAVRQAWLHLALLVLTLAALPIVPSPEWKPVDAAAPTWRVLGLLTVTVGAPYVLLSATAPLLQDWYARLMPSRTPYPLYALSNAGSLLALLSFPVVFEPLLSSGVQAWWWSVSFVLFVVACAWCAHRLMKAGLESTAVPDETSRDQPVTPSLDRLLWIALPACGSGLLLATTNQLCQDVAVVPLLWIVPLALYLITFIACFAGFYARGFWAVSYVVAAVAAAVALAAAEVTSIVVQAAALLGTLVAGCMVCHGELVRLRPRASQLTQFYLALSVGGGLGGLFVALAAPLLFDSYGEFPLLLFFVIVLFFGSVSRDRALARGKAMPAIVWAVPMVVFLLAGTVTLARGTQAPSLVAASRNFYGVLRVAQDDADAPVRGLYHGRVLHGTQFLAGPDRLRPTTYFGEGSGVDVALRQHERRVQGLPLSVGAIGLGVGTIASWGRPGDRIRFFELNPDVVEFAHRYFTFLSDSEAEVDVVLGDARLSLEREVRALDGRHTYDVLVVDAFSGNSIPVHLLTRESFDVYWSTLKPDGVLALHVSNRHLDLRPVVRGLAAEHGHDVLEVETEADAATGRFASTWMLVTGNEMFVERAAEFGVPGDSSPAATVVWTDDYSSLLSVLR